MYIRFIRTREVRKVLTDLFQSKTKDDDDNDDYDIYSS
jgi:hypothetical protein